MSDAIKNGTNNNNDTIMAITELLECPICLNTIVENDSFYTMICCKKKIQNS